MVEKFWSRNMTVLYPIPCYSEACYKGTVCSRCKKLTTFSGLQNSEWIRLKVVRTKEGASQFLAPYGAQWLSGRVLV